MHPLFSPNKLKLGVFGSNVSNGCAVTTAEGVFETTWPNAKAIAQIADRDGYEALVPVARWRGFGGRSNFNGTCFDTYTWAAGLGEATSDIAVFTTSHVPTVHPILAAKQGTTIDHITSGRFALNIVCGWFKPELEMFGAPIMAHDVRYEYAAEWVEVLKMLWTREDEFDYDGKYIRITKGFSMPKPIHKPFPPLMNAGGSERGQHFAAKYADMAFVPGPFDMEQSRARVASYRDLARQEYGRELQIWTNAYVVQRDTQAEADAYLKYYVVDRGDDAAVEQITRVLFEQSQTFPPEFMEPLKFHLKGGWGGYPLVGTPERIVAELEKFADIGIDGVVLSWVDYRDGLERWGREVMPLMEQAGLRVARPAEVTR